MTLRISAPAKVNLSLHITGKRHDGYHLLESFVVFTEFGDQLEIEAADTLNLEIKGPFASVLDGDNLVLRAARSLQSITGITSGAKITLTKNIPVGAGLGGGSSDAAAALRGLIKSWNVQIIDSELQKIALQLGSDVPICLTAKPAIIRGIGDDITPVNIDKNVWLLLVNPGVPLLTADVYKRYAAPFDTPQDHGLGNLAALHNSLEKPAIQLLPVIAKIVTEIARTQGCTCARMSGSGATCFGIYENKASAEHAAKQLNPAWWVQVTGLYGRQA